MKLLQACKTLAALAAKSDAKSESKVLLQLLNVMTDLSERDLSPEQLQPIEEATERLLLEHQNGGHLKRISRRFMASVRATLSLVPEGHYTALGLAFGVAFGAAIGSMLQGTSGMPAGTSGTGLGVGIGLIAGYFVGLCLDAEAAKQNRVLKTSPR